MGGGWGQGADVAGGVLVGGAEVVDEFVEQVVGHDVAVAGVVGEAVEGQIDQGGVAGVHGDHLWGDVG